MYKEQKERKKKTPLNTRKGGAYHGKSRIFIVHLAGKSKLRIVTQRKKKEEDKNFLQMERKVADKSELKATYSKVRIPKVTFGLPLTTHPARGGPRGNTGTRGKASRTKTAPCSFPTTHQARGRPCGSTITRGKVTRAMTAP
ncbi:unnamed protein product [Linum trigynum]|uniref:Uncharacterized protein n=1 Tax=Linum trigynum TaxID=586398 RepID=A0AAV2CD08_9ROSI